MAKSSEYFVGALECWLYDAITPMDIVRVICSRGNISSFKYFGTVCLYSLFSLQRTESVQKGFLSYWNKNFCELHIGNIDL